MPDPKRLIYEEMQRDVRQKLVVARDEVVRLETVDAYLSAELHRLGSGAAQVASSNGVHRGTEAGRPAGSVTGKLKDLPRHEAAVVALEEIGRPASIPEIADFMGDHNYASHLSRKILVTSLRTALDRKRDIFEQSPDGKWRLKKWDTKPSENA